MRTLPALFATLTLSASLGLAQSPFYFTQPASPQDMTAMATMIRTVVDMRDISVDAAHHSLTVQGPEDKVVVADWVFHQLDKPAGQDHSGPVPEYKLPGHDDVVRIFYVSPSGSNADLTAAVTAIRTIADLQRLFPYESQKAVVGRGSAAQIAAADWLLRQLSPYEGTAPTTDSPAYPSPIATASREPDAVIRVFRMGPDASNKAIVSTVTAIRTVADLQRLFPYETGKAIIASGAADKIATAEWIVHEKTKSSDPQAPHQTTLSGDTVRMIFVDPRKGQPDLSDLATQIRTKIGLQRVFSLIDPAAVVLRGRPDQMPVLDAMIAEYVAGSR